MVIARRTIDEFLGAKNCDYPRAHGVGDAKESRTKLVRGFRHR